MSQLNALPFESPLSSDFKGETSLSENAQAKDDGLFSTFVEKHIQSEDKANNKSSLEESGKNLSNEQTDQPYDAGNEENIGEQALTDGIEDDNLASQGDEEEVFVVNLTLETTEQKKVIGEDRFTQKQSDNFLSLLDLANKTLQQSTSTNIAATSELNNKAEVKSTGETVVESDGLFGEKLKEATKVNLVGNVDESNNQLKATQITSVDLKAPNIDAEHSSTTAENLQKLNTNQQNLSTQNKSAQSRLLSSVQEQQKVQASSESAAKFAEQRLIEAVEGELQSANENISTNDKITAKTGESNSKNSQSTFASQQNSTSPVKNAEGITLVSQDVVIDKISLESTLSEHVLENSSSKNNPAKNNVAIDTKTTENQQNIKQTGKYAVPIQTEWLEKSLKESSVEKNQLNNVLQQDENSVVTVNAEIDLQTEKQNSNQTPTLSSNTAQATNQFVNVQSQATDVSDFQQNAKIFENIANEINTEQVKQNKTQAQTLSETISIFRKDFTNAVKEKVMVMISQKLQQFEIRLDPPELGNVHVRVNLQGEQAVVNFMVQNQQAKEAFEQNLDKLKDMLAEHGVDVGDSNVEQQAHSDQESDENNQQLNDENNYLNTREQANEVNLSSKLFETSSTSVDYYA
jgi:flagellar hook-length control protein FliK